jgi:hypothetical protein
VIPHLERYREDEVVGHLRGAQRIRQRAPPDGHAQLTMFLDFCGDSFDSCSQPQVI